MWTLASAQSAPLNPPVPYIGSNHLLLVNNDYIPQAVAVAAPLSIVDVNASPYYRPPGLSKVGRGSVVINADERSYSTVRRDGRPFAGTVSWLL